MKTIKILLGVAGFLAFFTIAGYITDALAWVLSNSLPALLAGLALATITIVHKLAKAYL